MDNWFASTLEHVYYSYILGHNLVRCDVCGASFYMKGIASDGVKKMCSDGCMFEILASMSADTSNNNQNPSNNNQDPSNNNQDSQHTL